jgi:hypothetical protein
MSSPLRDLFRLGTKISVELDLDQAALATQMIIVRFTTELCRQAGNSHVGAFYKGDDHGPK